MMLRVFTWLIALLAASSAQAAEVRLRSTVSCPATIVRLGDVAEFVESDPAVAADLAAVPLFPAPSAGKSRQLDRHHVRQLLAISGIDLMQITLTGSETVVIQGAAGLVARPASPNAGEQSSIRLASHETPVPTRLQKLAEKTEKPAEPTLVKRGENVTVQSRAAGVRISTSGKALSDGVLGAEINIELADKRTKLLARVSGPQTVEVSTAKP